jgi:putative addiction module killer protein
MPETLITDPFDRWLKRLKDTGGKAAIIQRIRRVELDGHFGDHKQLSDMLFEMRIPKGPGYRVYYLQAGHKTVLLIGGTKKTQTADIKKAMVIADKYDDDEVGERGACYD